MLDWAGDSEMGGSGEGEEGKASLLCVRTVRASLSCGLLVNTALAQNVAMGRGRANRDEERERC